MTPPSASNPPVPATRKWLGSMVRDGGVAMRLAIALPLVAGGLLIVQAWLLAHVLDGAIVGRQPVAVLLVPVGLIAAVLATRIALGLAGEMFATRSSESIKLTLRSNLIADILGRPPTWTAAQSGGALSGLVLEQVESIDGYLTRYVPAMAQAAILPLAFAVVIVPVDWMVALLFLVTAPLIPVFMALAGWGAEAASRRQASALARLSGHFADRLRGLTTLKLFGREVAEVEGVATASEELRVRTMRVMRIAFLSSAILEFFAALGVAGVALYVGLTFLHLINVRGGPLALESGLFCLLMAPEVYAPLRLLATHYHDQAAAKAAAAEIAAQMGALPHRARETPLLQPPAAKSIGPLSLALRGISVSAPDGRSVVIEANLVLKPGEHVAILGESGVGKSTLLEAIAALREHSGTIDIGGATPSEVRSRIGMLGQRPTIFAGTIADNIRLGRRGACDTAVQVAARRAAALDFASELPEGLETVLGENGVGLSGGEIHRVALARLYLRDPGLLLLDEPTAHLDFETEARVLDGLMDFARGRTMVVVTHSDAVAARMNRCYRIVRGRLLPAHRPILVRSDSLRGAA